MRSFLRSHFQDFCFGRFRAGAFSYLGPVGSFAACKYFPKLAELSFLFCRCKTRKVCAVHSQDQKAAVYPQPTRSLF